MSASYRTMEVVQCVVQPPPDALMNSLEDPTHQFAWRLRPVGAGGVAERALCRSG
jgi:hypothetical protein